MGRAWAPAVATIFMSHRDQLLMDKLKDQPIFFKRYLDDLIFVANSEHHDNIILHTMQNLWPEIKIGTSSIGKVVNFLDLNLFVVGTEC